MAATATNIEVLQKNGIVAKQHNISVRDQARLNSLTDSEIKALISVKQKLGVAMLKKTSKDGRFPHPDTSSF